MGVAVSHERGTPVAGLGSHRRVGVTRSGRVAGFMRSSPLNTLRGYLAHKKHPPRRTLQERYATKPMMTLWGWVFLTSEVPLYGTHLCPDIRGGRDKIVDVFPGQKCRGASLIRDRLPLGPYSCKCLGSYGGPRGGGSFL